MFNHGEACKGKISTKVISVFDVNRKRERVLFNNFDNEAYALSNHTDINP